MRSNAGSSGLGHAPKGGKEGFSRFSGTLSSLRGRKPGDPFGGLPGGKTATLGSRDDRLGDLNTVEVEKTNLT
jgi:hypothetical protein